VGLEVKRHGSGKPVSPPQAEMLRLPSCFGCHTAAGFQGMQEGMSEKRLRACQGIPFGGWKLIHAGDESQGDSRVGLRFRIQGISSKMRVYSVLKSTLTLPASPCRIAHTVCGSPSRHY
jgi:hypothetical protein